MTATLIRNVTLVDGTGADPLPDAAVLVDGERIREAGPAGRIRLPDAPVQEVDGGGGFLLPGLIDTHVHVMIEGIDLARDLQTPFSLRFYRSISNLRRTLETGITSVRDAGGADAGLKEALERGEVAGPRIQISIAVLSTTGGHGDLWMRSGVDVATLFPAYPGFPRGIVDGVDAMRQRVREILRAGADVVKLCSTGGVFSPTDHPEFTQFSPEELAVAVQEAAYRRGRKVMAHAQGAEGIKNAVRAGVVSIEHGIYLDDEAIELMVEHGTFLVPTLLAPLAILEIAEERGTIPDYALAKAQESVEAHRDSIRRAHRAGVRIAMGTDAGVMPHGTNLRELGLMVDAGLTPMDAIVATTKTAAECMGWEDRVGTVEAGKLADLVLVDGDPLSDIRVLEDLAAIAAVWQGGELVVDRRDTDG